MAGCGWNVVGDGAVEETVVVLAFRLCPPVVGNYGRSWSTGMIQSCLSVFIQRLHEPRVRSAGAWGYLWSTGGFSLEPCLAHSR